MADADSGIRKAKEKKPDLIVLDLKLPGQDGIEVYKILKSNPSTQTIPVLFLTAMAGSGGMTGRSIELLASFKHGVHLEGKYAVMGKPYDPKGLIAAIRGLLYMASQLIVHNLLTDSLPHDHTSNWDSTAVMTSFSAGK